jgi:hypothetical protein
MVAFPRRWFRFRLTLLLLLVTQACVAMAWARVQLKAVDDRQECIHRSFVKYGGNVPIQLRIFGERGIRQIFVGLPVNGYDERIRIIRLFPEADVTF